MSYPFYKIVHIFAVLLLFTALGGAAMHNAQGGTRATNAKRGLVGMTHGIALMLILVAGFGAAGKAGFFEGGFPGWLIAKIVLWVVFGAALTPLSRVKGSGRVLWLVRPVLGGVAAWLAIAKPF